MSDIKKTLVSAGVDSALKNGGVATIEEGVLDVERVFIHWLDSGMTATPHKLSKETGVAVKEIKEMLASGVFQKKYMEVQEGFTEIAEPYLKARAKQTMENVMGRLSQIVDQGQDKDAIAAGRLIADLATTKSAAVETNINVDSRVLQLAADGLKDMDEVRKALAAQLDSNIIESTEIRTKKG